MIDVVEEERSLLATGLCCIDLGLQGHNVGPDVVACWQVILEVHGTVNLLVAGGNLRKVVRLQLRMEMHAVGIAGLAGSPYWLTLSHLRIVRFRVVVFVHQSLIYLRQVAVGDVEAMVGLDRDIGPQGVALCLVYDCGDPSGRHGVDGFRRGPVDAVVSASQSCIPVTGTQIVEQIGDGKDLARCEGQGQTTRSQGSRVGLPGDGRLIGIDVVQPH